MDMRNPIGFNREFQSGFVNENVIVLFDGASCGQTRYDVAHVRCEGGVYRVPRSHHRHLPTKH